MEATQRTDNEVSPEWVAYRDSLNPPYWGRPVEERARILLYFECFEARP